MMSSGRIQRLVQVVRASRNLSSHAVPFIHNSLSDNLEPLQVTPQINWYACGPTVYDDAHLGHARTYVCFDVIRRIITSHFNLPLHFAMGVTDIDDKIINRAGQLNTTPQKLAREYEHRFFDDMKSLGVLEPHARLRVSENVPHIISYIQTIIENGHAYVTDSGVYFDVSNFGNENYGRFTQQFDDNRDLSESSFGSHKRDRRDFALWKCFPDSNTETGDCWESPWGTGRPGWHIECSVLTHIHFGPRLHIHSGGRDLAFPHHCNEIAQCESHRNEPGKGWGDLWMHTGHLYIAGRKMSKSLKNFISVREILEAGVHRDDVRMFCLQHHYRADVQYSEDRIHEARSVRLNMARFVERAASLSSSNGGWGKSERNLFDAMIEANNEINVALSSDFDTPSVIRTLHGLVRTADAYVTQKEKLANKVPSEPIGSVSRLVVDTLSLMGMSTGSEGVAKQSQVGSSLVDELVKYRCMVRETAKKGLKEKSTTGFVELLSASDEIRDKVLPSHGFYLEDRPSGSFLTSVPPVSKKGSEVK